MGPAGVWRKLLEWTGEGRPCSLLLVARTVGSGPGSPGSVMAVSCDGTWGTVGGGAMEKELVDLALRKMRRGDQVPEPVFHRHTEGSEESSGMICSGTQTTLVIPVTGQIAEELENLCEMLSSGQPGTLTITDGSFELSRGDPPPGGFFTETEGAWRYTGPLGVSNTVYIIGGGHVGRALAALLPMLSFRPVIIDSRDSTFLPHPPCCTWITAPFADARLHMEPGSNSWAVIMTPEHLADARVLSSLHGLELRYVGLMASRKKKEAIFDRLSGEGIPLSFLESVHCPVGMPIGSRTPEEIAVSVAAELVGVRSGSLP